MPRVAVNTTPSAKSDLHCYEYRGDDENKAFQGMGCGCVLDEPPYDILAVDQVRYKSGPDDKLMHQRLVTVLELGSFE